MKTTRIVLSLIVLSMLWCADVFAHWFDNNWNVVGNGTEKPASATKPVRHFDPCTGNDPSVDNEQDKTDCINNGYLVGHGHVDKTHDSKQTTRVCGDTGLAVGMRQLLELVQKVVGRRKW